MCVKLYKICHRINISDIYGMPKLGKKIKKYEGKVKKNKNIYG